MAIPWLTALKVVPWGDVIEHAPKVLGAARQLLERQKERQRKKLEDGETPLPASGADDDQTGPADPVEELRLTLEAQAAEIDRLRQTQMALTDTLAELAEQHARLVTTAEALRIRSRTLGWCLVALALGFVAGGIWLLSR
ncbi:hypothetical protein [Hydrogenophaga sp. 5NK40-0174]|uniref:hypothetical protein n=1 Tax=Hydrogenophaga sp. 5NK40-0174 TaxID=3127649 RepID=UPI003102B0BF